MKKYLFALFALLCTQHICAQTFELPKYAYPFGYDSTLNDFFLERMAMFVGQKLVVLPLCAENEVAGYPFFFRKPPNFDDFTYENGEVKLQNPAMVYESNRDNPFITPRKVLENKNFIIVGTETVYDKMDDNNYFILWILEGDDKKQFYYGFPPPGGMRNHGVTFPFVVYGFYEKLNTKWKNKTILSTKEAHYNDIENGKSIKVSKGEEFLIEKALFSPISPCAYVDFGFLIHSKDKKKNLFIPLNELDVEFHFVSYENPVMMSFIRADLQTSLNIDKGIWVKIFETGISAGMPKELVRELLGEPANITYAGGKSAYEQWEYGMDYSILFVNGKVSTTK